MMAMMWPNTPVSINVVPTCGVVIFLYFYEWHYDVVIAWSHRYQTELSRLQKKKHICLCYLSASPLPSFCTILFSLYCFHTFLVCVSGVCVHRHSNIACKWTASLSWLGMELPLFRPWPLPSLPGLPSPAEWQWSWATEEAQAGEYDREQAAVNMDGDAAGEVWVVFLEGKEGKEEESHRTLDSGTTARLSLRWQRRKACRCAEL